MRDLTTLKKLMGFDKNFLQNIFAILCVPKYSPSDPISRWPVLANNFSPARHKRFLRRQQFHYRIVVVRSFQISSFHKKFRESQRFTVRENGASIWEENAKRGCDRSVDATEALATRYQASGMRSKLGHLDPPLLYRQ